MIRCPVANWKRERPEALALPGISYRELDGIISRLCGPISSVPENILAFVPNPSVLDIAFFFAAWRMGKAVYPISFRHPQAAIEDRIKKTGAALVSPELGKPVDVDTIDENALATLIETSSSAKIVCHPFKSHLISANSCARALNLEIGDSYCLNLPLFHISGLATVMRTFVSGATLVFPGDPATHISMVPTQLYRLKDSLPKFKCLLVGGAPLPPSLQHLPIYSSYGMTESASMALIKPPGGPITVLPHIELKLIQDGEIYLQGPSLFTHYFGKQALTDWFPTGDIANEHLEIVGRKDRQFISGGENIIPEEIEAALLQIAGVIEARVTPEDDPEFGMRPVATIYCTKELAVEHIQRALERTLPRFKIPKKMIISPTPLPSKQQSLAGVINSG